MPAPVASGWSDLAGWALHPLESAAFSRRTPHPGLEGPERVFDGLSSNTHGLGHAVEPGLHLVKHLLILPALDAPQLGRRALGSERTGEASAQVAVEIVVFRMIRPAMGLGEFCPCRAGVVVVLGVVEKVLPGEEAAFGPARRQGLGHDGRDARAGARQNVVAAEVAPISQDGNLLASGRSLRLRGHGRELAAVAPVWSPRA